MTAAVLVKIDAQRSAAPDVLSFARIAAALKLGHQYLMAATTDPSGAAPAVRKRVLLRARLAIVDFALCSYAPQAIASDLRQPCLKGNGLSVRQSLRDLFDDLLAALALTRAPVADARSAGDHGAAAAALHLRFIDATLALGYSQLEYVDAVANGLLDAGTMGSVEIADAFTDQRNWPLGRH